MSAEPRTSSRKSKGQWRRDLLQSIPTVTGPLKFPATSPKLWKGDFDGFAEKCQANFELTGPVATHGRRLRTYAEGEDLFLDIPRVALRPRFTAHSIDQLLKILEVGGSDRSVLPRVFEHLSREGAANVLNEMLHWKFSSPCKEGDLIKQTRAISPFLEYPESGSIGTLRGIWWSDYPRIYDAQICEALEPFMGNLVMPLAVMTDSQTFLVVVNDSVGIDAHPAFAVFNHETGSEPSRFLRTAWIPSLGCIIPCSGDRGENYRWRPESFANEFAQCLHYLDSRTAIADELAYFEHVDKEKWFKTWSKQDWNQLNRKLKNAEIIARRRIKALTGRHSLIGKSPPRNRRKGGAS